MEGKSLISKDVLSIIIIYCDTSTILKLSTVCKSFKRMIENSLGILDLRKYYNNITDNHLKIIINKYKNLKEINISNMKSITQAFETLSKSKIEILKIEGCQSHELDLNNISSLKSVVELNLSSPSFRLSLLEIINQIELLPNLQRLTLSNFRVDTFQLKKLKKLNLTKLDLSNSSHSFSYLDFIKEEKENNLVSLNLSGSKIFYKTVNSFDKLKNLTDLNISNTLGVDDQILKQISMSLLKLKSLNLRSCEINDINCLSQLFFLNKIDLSSTKIKNFSVLFDLPIFWLNLSQNKSIDVFCISELSRNEKMRKNLKYLGLANTSKKKKIIIYFFF